MPGRRRAREMAMQALYEADITGLDPRLSLRQLLLALMDDDGSLGTVGLDAAEEEFATALVNGAADQRARVDELVDSASLNWRLVRMPVVDRNILRLACYELMEMQEIPVSVTINEAVELAKRFGGADSRAFVNGILDRIAFELGRGGRGQRNQ